MIDEPIWWHKRISLRNDQPSAIFSERTNIEQTLDSKVGPLSLEYTSLQSEIYDDIYHYVRTLQLCNGLMGAVKVQYQKGDWCLPDKNGWILHRYELLTVWAMKRGGDFGDPLAVGRACFFEKREGYRVRFSISPTTVRLPKSIDAGSALRPIPYRKEPRGRREFGRSLALTKDQVAALIEDLVMLTPASLVP